MNDGPNIIPVGPLWSIATWLSWEQVGDKSSMHSKLRYLGSTTELKQRRIHRPANAIVTHGGEDK